MRAWRRVVPVLVALLAPAGAYAATSVQFYVAPGGSGSTCTRADPCSLAGAQRAVRAWLERHRTADVNGGAPPAVRVNVGAGVYRLRGPLVFTAADSGDPKGAVTWRAEEGTHPVLSGSIRIRGWRPVDRAANVWAAPVPAGLPPVTQVYADGAAAPVDQASPRALGLDLAQWNVRSGFIVSGATKRFFAALAAHMTATQLESVRFVWNPAPPTDWQESECPLAAVHGKVLSVAQPCWNNLTNKSPTLYGGNASNVTPFNLKAGSAPTALQNLYVPATGAHPPAPGQWYLDAAAHRLYYVPLRGQNVARLDIEVPIAETLLKLSGTLTHPVANLAFEGLTFSGTNWAQPATGVGFPQVQANLDVTQANVTRDGSVAPATQGECHFARPAAGSCPWAAFAEPVAAVVLSAARNVTLRDDTFRDLGAIGVKVEYGSARDRIQGNVFTQIASSAIWVGCSGDPDPGSADDPAATVIALCAADPRAAAADGARAGSVDEIVRHTTLADNLIHHVGYGYYGAAGITLLFTRHTTIAHNDMFDLPYDAITSGAWQGHVNVPRRGEPVGVYYDTSRNINAYNVIEDNLFHQVMQAYGDGGAIYTEGHQGPTRQRPDGGIDRAASYGRGLVVRGNVADMDSTHKQYFYAPDVGSQWVTVTGNVEWNAPASGHAYSMSSHWPDAPKTVYTWTAGNWFANPDDTPHSPGLGVNNTIPTRPGAHDLPLGVLRNAGLSGTYWALATTVAPSIYYSQRTGRTLFVAGDGLTPQTCVRVGATVMRMHLLSPAFATAQLPPGTPAGAVAPVACTPVARQARKRSPDSVHALPVRAGEPAARTGAGGVDARVVTHFARGVRCGCVCRVDRRRRRCSTASACRGCRGLSRRLLRARQWRWQRRASVR
ncbi:MAG TPA: right-handed parallel beta-helix repeat-containing protein [Rhodanobacteraceae bacterium]